MKQLATIPSRIGRVNVLSSSSTGLRAIYCVVAMVLSSAALAQERPRADVQNPERESLDFSGGTADEWIKVLLESTVDEFTNRVVDRLSYFHLTSTQVGQLKSAAQRDSSDSKRIALWQAIRQSRDIEGRSYLIQNLLNKSSKEVQIQFIEQLRNPCRFDVPILVALYNSHRPPPKADFSASPRQPLAQGSQEPNADPRAIASEVFDVPRTILEFTCHSKWSDTTITPGSPYQYESSAPNETRAKYLALALKRKTEAQLAQLELVHWLIKNGFEDEHRLEAFQAFMTVDQKISAYTSRHPNFASELLKGLEKPESRAKAARLALDLTEPSEYLEDEAEVVRLSAIDCMGTRLIQTRSAPSVRAFIEKAELYKPVLERVLRNDISPQVQAAAKRLLATIAELEKQPRPVPK